MKFHLAGILSFLLITSTAAAEDRLTVGKAIQTAKHNQTYAAVIFATWDGARRMHDYLELRDAPYVYCVKKDVEMDMSSVNQMVREFVESHPENEAKTFDMLGLVVIQSMKWKFPCD
jgi:hypothetical protein